MRQVKVKFTRNGYKTELNEDVAKVYEKKGRVEIVKGKPGRPAQSTSNQQEGSGGNQ